MPRSKWTEPPTKKAALEERKKRARQKGAANMVKRRNTIKKVREELEASPPPPPGEVPLMDAMDLLPPGDPVPEIRGYDRQGIGSTYREEYARIAQEMCALGATDIQVARALGVSLSTMWGWQARHEEFFRAMIVGKDLPDYKVERALYQRAVGYSYPEFQVLSHGGQVTAIVPVIKHIPPDVNAAKSWLRARRRDEWSEQATLNLTSEESFGNLWHAVSQGQVMDLAAITHGDGEETS